MDINAKMVELEALWQDSFDLCKAMIESCKNGEQKLTGSLLKELNAYIKNSVDFLRYREAEQAFSGTEAEENDDAELNELLKSVVSRLDGGPEAAHEPLESQKMRQEQLELPLDDEFN